MKRSVRQNKQSRRSIEERLNRLQNRMVKSAEYGERRWISLENPIFQ
jgi:hypothetical protein